ncbi:hypothetical protein [Sideroxydans sp. CL21]|uniref:hypothetical protein n=1 Tax=Sideroxydans sp. CL21 TaxID=2600596 RepID=UPI0024BBF61E|nr:hypothetical protein [Sideroxydans sp. CL21]
MDKQKKYLLLGATLAVLILIGGYLTSIYDRYHVASLNGELNTLAEKCKTETAGMPLWARAPEGPWTKYQKIPAFCDSQVFTKLGGDEIQKQLDELQSTSGHAFKNTINIALFVFLLFGAPYVWYFLLRRIRELKDAITGK